MPEEVLKDFKTTADLKVPEKIIDQVIGQEEGVNIIKKAARQRRNVFLIGEPGTGKSMLGMAMAELLPVEELIDIVVLENPDDNNNPRIQALKAGEGKEFVEKEKVKAISGMGTQGMVSMIILLFALMIPWVLLHLGVITEVMAAASLVVAGMLGIAVVLSLAIKPKRGGPGPKLLVDNSKNKMAPYIEATGARAGALLGDVRHDPFQSGGLGTPPHMRVEPGMIHKANKGVLFIDEVSTLTPKSQQELLTAMQEKKYSITGQSEMSSGAMVRTEPVPCDFVLVAAGNLLDLKNMHPALRSRIRGYGYEIYLNDTMDDTPENRNKIVQFVAQEIRKDGKISPFSSEAAETIVMEAKRRAGRKKKLTLKFRDLGGLVRAAGDVAREENSRIVTEEHVKKARNLARTLEQQIADKYISQKKEYSVFATTGSRVGKVNGLAVMGDGGIMLPIEAEVAPAQSQSQGRTIATGKLGEIAKEAVLNVGAIIKKYKGKGITGHDIHVQFIQTYEGVEGDSASISVATAVISAMEQIPVKQDVAMTGSLSVRGEVLPVGGVTPKAEAAIAAGIRAIIVPKANKDDVLLSKKDREKIKVIETSDLYEVLEEALEDCPEKKKLLKQLKSVTA